jgi:hypothetical protein
MRKRYWVTKLPIETRPLFMNRRNKLEQDIRVIIKKPNFKLPFTQFMNVIAQTKTEEIPAFKLEELFSKRKNKFVKRFVI